MKRLTSIFLVLAMILTLAPMNIFAAEVDKPVFSDMKDTDYYAQAATALEQLDILAGYPDGTFGAEKSITRAEMAAIVCRMIDKEADAEKAKGETAFEDVKSDHWASGYINIASKEGIINGDGNGKFRPEDDVKHEEAIKMVVCALGYGDDVEVDAKDWSKGYLEVADEKGISDDLKGTKGKASTRGDVAVMSYNGLATESENSKIPATPVASKDAGEYKGTQKVKLTTATKDAEIYYTTDGTIPTVKSTKYTKEISISKTSTLKAIAVKNGVVSKDVMSVDYTVKQVSSGGGGGGGSSSPSTPTYTVSFDLNYEGATGAPTNQSIRSGNKATEPTAPEREGYVFGGWYKETECVNSFNFNTDTITSTITLYAKWVGNDTNILQTASELLNIQYSDGDTSATVTKNIILPTSFDVDEDGTADVTVTWNSNNESAISNTGIVTRPVNDNAVVSLTATLSHEENETDKIFSCTVIKVNERNESNIENHDSIDDLTDYNDGITPDVYLENGDISTVDGVFSDVKVHCSEDAILSLNSVKDIMGIASPSEEFIPSSSTIDEFGGSYVLNQQLNNIEVYGRNITVSTDSEGNANYLTSNYLESIDVENSQGISDSESITILKEIYGDENIDYTYKGLVIYSLGEFEANPVLVHRVNVSNLSFETEETAITPVDEDVFIDAESGDIVYVEQNLLFDYNTTGSGKDELENNQTFPVRFKNWDWLFYYMQDTNRNIDMYKKSVSSSHRIGSEFNLWTNKSAVSAYTNVIRTYDWYKSNLNRTSLDNNGLNLKVIVNRSGGTNNAYYTSSDDSLNFFDNSWGSSYPHTTAACLDVMAHEYTHGVVQYITGGIPYQRATGAINEAYADIMGCLVEGDWVMGEDWTGTSDGLRNISNPLVSGCPASYLGTNWVSYNSGSDNGGVHTNCTVLSYAAYLMNNRGIDNSTLAKLWYKSLQLGYNSSSQFTNVRLNVVKAAKMLGLSDAKKEIINKCFDDVNVLIDYSLSGKITIADADTDMTNNIPLQGATVKIEGLTNRIIKSATTNSSGDYKINNIKAGKYRVTVSKEGYVDVTQILEFDVDINNYFNITIETISEENTGNGYASGFVYDVQNGSTISGLTLNVREGINNIDGDIIDTITTDSNGKYITNELPSGNYTIQIIDERDVTNKYCDGIINIKIFGNTTIENQNGYVTMVINDDEIRIVLTWGATPSDLDSHIVGPTSSGSKFHVYYSDKTHGSDVMLDVDDTSSYGPETITISKQYDGKYTYAVHDYSNKSSSSSVSMSNSGAQVKVYQGERLIQIYNVPTDRTGTLWTVFEYDSRTKTITNINTMSNHSDSSTIGNNVSLFSLNQDSYDTPIDMIFEDILSNEK